MYLQNCHKTLVSISNSEFNDLNLSEWGNNFGSIIANEFDRSANKPKLNFINCEFNDCHARIAISYCCSVYIDGCYFSNCHDTLFGCTDSDYEKGPNENKFIGCGRET